jgi:hypothetical protein
MEADRPQKRTVRQFWLQEVQRISGRHIGDQVPLYLTLPGAEGRDIEILAKAGIISLTQVHGISAKDKWKIVAVESSPMAAFSLQDRFPGLKIIEAPLQSLLSGDSQLRWPQGEHENLCRARVINLDVDEPVSALEKSGHITFPLLERIYKFALIHAEPDPTEWTLLLTVHGECLWNSSISRSVQQFLLENCQREPMFAKGLRHLLGEDLFNEIAELRVETFDQLGFPEQQRILTAFVPKKIASLVHHRWRVTTQWTFFYGGSNREAPMVTWGMYFDPDPRASKTPDAVYRESIRTVFRRVGEIMQDGSIQEHVTMKNLA